MKSVKRILPFACIALLAAVAAVIALAQQGRHGRSRGTDEGAVPVVAATARTADVPVYLEGVGTVQAFNTVTVHTQVDGQLIAVAFREGQDVKKGELLAQIDPATYRAQLEQAQAKKALDETQLANARVDLERYVYLVQTDSGPKQQADTQRALVAQLEAQIKQDQAAIDMARAQLGYTTIVSPLDGRTGIRQVDQGNIVHSADTNGIVVITQLRPISVIFTLPQQTLPQVNRAAAHAVPTVEALADDHRSARDRGVLTVVDNQVDQTTGTIRIKATFPNAELQLWPGQFVNIRLLVDTLRNAVVVPAAAVQQGPNGTFVYVVGSNNKVSLRTVSVAQQGDNETVIGQGLESGEQVVTTGFARLSDGKAVRVGASGGTGRGEDAER